MAERKAVVRVWFNVDETDRIELPITAFISLQIVEACDFFSPMFELNIVDPYSIYLDEVGCAWVTVNLARSKESPAIMFKGAILSMPEASPPYIKEIGRQPRTFRGVPWYILPFYTTSARRSFGLTSSSEVFKTICEEVLRKAGAKPYWLVEDSVDRERYIQPGWPHAQFLQYLANKAVSHKGYGGYVVWTDFYLQKGDSKFVRCCFCTPSHLARQGSKHKIIVTQHPELLEEAEKNDGKLSTGELVALGLSYQYQTSFSIADYGRTVAAYDVEKERTYERYFTYDDYGFVSIGSKRNRAKYDVLYTLPSPNRYLYEGDTPESYFKARASCIPHRSYFKRNVGVLVYARDDIRLGDKVTLTVPMYFNEKPQMTSVAGDWIVTRISHIVDAPSLKYMMKLVLSRDEYLGEA